MYFPIRWPKFLNISKEERATLVCVNSDYNRILFAVLTEDSIGIWLEKLCIQIVCHHRDQESIAKHGKNWKLVWKRDSTMVAVLTSKSHLLLYHLETEESGSPLFEQVDSSVSTLKRESSELFVRDAVLPLHMKFASHICVSGEVANVLSLGDELLVACTSGHILRIGWDASVHQDFALDLRDVPFTCGGSCRQSCHGDAFEIRDIQYLPLLGGLSVVFTCGRAAVLMTSSQGFEPKDVNGIWIPDVTDATVTAVNHRYRLVAYGLRSGEGVVFYLDDASGQFITSHRLALSAKDFPDAGSVGGAVALMQWTPDSTAVAVSWEKGGFALWSVFGSLLVCSLNWNASVSCKNLFAVHSMEWGAEGYHLWMVTSPSSKPEERDIILMNFVKSASTVNPGPQSGRQHVLLQGSDCVLISSESDLADSGPGLSWSQDRAGSRGNKHWTVERVPHTYLSINWPIRYSAIDAGCNHIAVAGRGGLAHFSLAHNKWKVFGNETQEQDFVVTGGLLWWDSFIVLGCVNVKDGRDEIRVYPRNTKLDNSFSRICKVNDQVLQMSLSEDRLLVFLADYHLVLYQLHLGGLDRLQDMDLTNIVPHPLCVVSATLAHVGGAKHGILLNVCGRLVLLQQDQAPVVGGAPAGSGAPPPPPPPPPRVGPRWSTPTVLASCVEKVWVAGRSPDPRMPHLTQALWIACGVNGMQVWLPLFPPPSGANGAPTAGSNVPGATGFLPRHNFMAKRIMLPITVHIYPLAVLFEEAVVLGAESDTALCGSNDLFPLCVVSKSSQVYLHPILRQLLCRNLGYHAWEIARSCSALPYFHHSLELLLHEVLEEEAMSSEPIPDALLPRVIDFIREFPVFLQTVVQCARKTELALWPHLFAAVGNPKDLFQECLLQGQLDTAASYLLVLQNLEVALVSRQHATLLLGAALDAGCWALAKDLVRFLRAIDPADAESPPRAALGPPPPPLPHTDDETINQVFIDVILSRHARKLLAAGHLRKLGSFAAHLDFPLDEFLQKERTRAGRVDDYVVALKAVHQDFEWPLPVSMPNVNGENHTTAPTPPEEHVPPQHRNGGGADQSPERGNNSAGRGFPRESPAESESASEDSWWPEEEEAPATPIPDWRGSPQAEAQARHMLQVLGQARCCDWALVLAVMLRDSLVAPLVAPDGTLAALEEWALKECPGYVGFLQMVLGHTPEEPSLPTSGELVPAPRLPRTAPPQEGTAEEGCRVA
ncbi:guanine nucleotide exchange factor subunit RIC1-like [Ornithodoros turicata]|uniref:guanine nucleotide exchange factor subunit RIC1-like n=1 Tax=Ornithodoros turicata TaxID=34597 RepID=UPI0031392F52